MSMCLPSGRRLNDRRPAQQLYRSPGPFCLGEVYPFNLFWKLSLVLRDGAAQFGADRPVNGPAMSARSAAILNAIGSAAGALKRVSSVAAGASCADRPAPGPRAWPVACI